MKIDNRKKAVGYIRAAKTNCAGDREIQRALIEGYLSACSNVTCIKIFEDPVPQKTYRELSGAMSTPDRETTYIRNSSFPAREKMLSLVESGEVDLVVVDTKERLYSNMKDKQRVERVFNRKEIELIEVPPFMSERADGTKNICIYHYFIPSAKGKGIRTANLLSDLGIMYEKVYCHADWKVCGVYLDYSAYRRREIFKMFERQDMDVIILKYFYHLNRKTLAFIQLVQELTRRSVTLMSTEEGILRYKPGEDILNEHSLKVVTYDCFRSDQEKNDRSITSKKFDVFYRTLAKKWQEVHRYIDEGTNERPAFSELRNRIVDYDIVVVDTFGKFGESVNELVRYLDALKKPVYSLKEGLLYIEGERHEIQSDFIQQGIDSS